MLTHGWALILGIAAAVLPVVIHWLTRPRPTRLPVSTLRFIRGAVAQRRSRYRLRDLLVLLFRTAAILLFAGAIARPLLQHQRVESKDQAATVTRIILLDCSASMAARDGGVARFERARPIVSDLLRFESGLKANLLLAGSNANPVFDIPTTNLSALRDSLTKAQVTSQRFKVQAALNTVAEIFQQADPDSQLELHIVSDFQRSNWATANFAVLPEACETKLSMVAPASQDAVNLALLSVESKGRIEAGRDANLNVTVGNYSDTPRLVRVEVQVGDIFLPLEGLCAARSQMSINGSLPIATAGWHTGSARLVSADDVFPADDSLPVALKAWPQPKVAMLTRDTKNRSSSASWFLQQALLATGNGGGGDGSGSGSGGKEEGLRFVDAADPDSELLQAADIVLVVRSGRLSSDTISVLKAMLQRGRGVLYVAADQLDAANLNDLVASLGSSARMPVTYIPQASDRGGVRRFLANVNRRTSPFSVFGDELSAAIGSLEFKGGLVTRETTEGLADDIRATLNDQSAFLSVTAAGRGRLAVMNVDLERSSLARTPVLVPLLGELVSRDLVSTGDARTEFLCGEPLTLQLGIGEEALADLTINGPQEKLSEAAAGTFTAVPAGVVWNVAAAGPPGVYEVKRNDQIVDVAVTAIPDEESDLRSLTEDVFVGRLSGGRQLQFSAGIGGDQQTQDVTWVWLAAACVGCLLAELLTLKLFRA